MIFTDRLKIWTLVSHAFIVIGLGHGIITLGLAEFWWLSTVFDSQQSHAEDGEVSLFTLQLVGLICLLGQIACIASFFVKSTTPSKGLHVGGVCLLWTSVITYAYWIRNDNYAHLALYSCLPFLYCTLKMLLAERVILLWQKIQQRM